MRGVLLDENLPVRLAKAMTDAGVVAHHISHFQLDGKADGEVWSRALAESLAVMTKDADFANLVFGESQGQVVLVVAGNLRLHSLLSHVAAKIDEIRQFLESDDRIVVI